MIDEIYLNPDWPIFKYHFEDCPILPGGLLFDFLFSNTWWEYCYTGFFHKKCVPDSVVKVNTKSLNRIELEENGERLAHFILHHSLPLVSQISKNGFQNLNKISINKFCFRHSKEIIFLDSIDERITKKANGYEGFGCFEYRRPVFLSCMYNECCFGILYILLEFMGFTCLAISSEIFKEMKIQSYIFGYIKKYMIYRVPKEGDELVSRVFLERLGSNILWSGEVYDSEGCICSVGEVLSINEKNSLF